MIRPEVISRDHGGSARGRQLALADGASFDPPRSRGGDRAASSAAWWRGVRARGRAHSIKPPSVAQERATSPRAGRICRWCGNSAVLHDQYRLRELRLAVRPVMLFLIVRDDSGSARSVSFRHFPRNRAKQNLRRGRELRVGFVRFRRETGLAPARAARKHHQPIRFAGTSHPVGRHLQDSPPASCELSRCAACATLSSMDQIG